MVAFCYNVDECDDNNCNESTYHRHGGNPLVWVIPNDIVGYLKVVHNTE